jgi:lipooligosaccharide transport system permease protein
MWVSAIIKTIDETTYITSVVLTPLFLVAGTFFPIDNLSPALQVAAWFNPLYHCVELVRAASFGWELPVDLYHVAFLAVFAVAMWALAVRQLRRRLVD